MKLKAFLIILTVAVVVAVSVMAFLPPKVTVNAQGTIAISNTASKVPQFDIVSISNIPAYGVIEPSGCGEFKGRVKIRFDMLMEPTAPFYDKCYVEVIDTASPEYLGGYQGKVDEFGEPLDWEDYQKWIETLPTVWQNNSFHSHFVYFDTDATDDAIKSKIAEVAEYFYAFHLYCWDNELTFLSQWVKVPKEVGTIRDVFVAGDSSPPSKEACELKSDDIVSRLTDFDTRSLEESIELPPPLNIGEKGTIDVGSDATNRGTSFAAGTTAVDKANPANATGTIDTVQIYNYVGYPLYNVEVATFIDEGSDVLSTRGNETVGTVDGTPDTCTGLDIDVTAGDYIGLYFTSGYLKKDSSGGVGLWSVSGDYITCESQAFSYASGEAISLYGTGTESGGAADISNDPATWSIGTVVTSTDYWSSGSAPTFPLDDGECHYTVTNNGDACSITVSGTNFTGGVGWTLAGSPGANTVTMKAGKSGDANEGAMITLTTEGQAFISGLAGSATKKWELMMETGTFTDGALKTGAVTLTATLD